MPNNIDVSFEKIIFNSVPSFQKFIIVQQVTEPRYSKMKLRRDTKLEIQVDSKYIK